MTDECYWAKLPQIFKLDVVKYLDFKDRCSLRKSSKSNKELVEDVPTSVVDLGFMDRCVPGIGLEYQETPLILNGIVHERIYKKIGENVVQDFLRVFDHPKSKVSFFYVILDYTTEDNTSEFLSKFNLELLKRPSSYKIRTKQFNWICKDQNDHVLNVLERLDSEILYGIQIDCPITSESLQKVLDTEQCRNAKRLGIGSRCKFDLPVAKFFDKNEIFVSVWKISPEEIWETIENFRSTPRPIGSRFNFCNYTSNNNLFDISSILKLFDVESCNVYEHDNPDKYHVQVFEMEENALKVEMNARGVSGTVVIKKL